MPSVEHWCEWSGVPLSVGAEMEAYGDSRR